METINQPISAADVLSRAIALIEGSKYHKDHIEELTEASRVLAQMEQRLRDDPEYIPTMQEAAEVISAGWVASRLSKDLADLTAAEKSAKNIALSAMLAAHPNDEKTIKMSGGLADATVAKQSYILSYKKEFKADVLRIVYIETLRLSVADYMLSAGRDMGVAGLPNFRERSTTPARDYLNKIRGALNAHQKGLAAKLMLAGLSRFLLGDGDAQDLDLELMLAVLTPSAPNEFLTYFANRNAGDLVDDLVCETAKERSITLRSR
jgi:hypothetical protein